MARQFVIFATLVVVLAVGMASMASAKKESRKIAGTVVDLTGGGANAPSPGPSSAGAPSPGPSGASAPSPGPSGGSDQPSIQEMSDSTGSWPEPEALGPSSSADAPSTDTFNPDGADLASDQL
ncbi:hypothetical protein ACET3Z_030361 [Daucus carota]